MIIARSELFRRIVFTSSLAFATLSLFAPNAEAGNSSYSIQRVASPVDSEQEPSFKDRKVSELVVEYPAGISLLRSLEASGYIANIRAVAPGSYLYILGNADSFKNKPETNPTSNLVDPFHPLCDSLKKEAPNSIHFRSSAPDAFYFVSFLSRNSDQQIVTKTMLALLANEELPVILSTSRGGELQINQSIFFPLSVSSAGELPEISAVLANNHSLPIEP